ncbi:amino acid ABC transporter substrate-binding protein [Paenibacillus tritici]|uniref:Amino acid ABC transporter substrate-binding protein n=1 Tax=Paenibacillus tritici TaxID=1873425 RepID=A0ABX2DMX8_9BACL|nr:amino acid ABC transporter substrate-binding protein [Paenibacillus tritici]NQX45196.1 amino acid ABC transporter substrate-binding protein [Paenibacillus tritici]
MKRQGIWVLFVILAVAIIGGCSSSGGKDGQLVIGIDDKFAPMGFRDDNNEIVGFDIDYAKAAAAKMGREVTFQPIDWSAKESELNSGRIDMIWNGYTITDERKDKVLFTKPYLENSQVVVVLADSALNKLQDLAGHEIGLQSLSSAADALDANPIKAELAGVSEFTDNVLALTDLKSGRLDGVVIDEVVARYYIAKEPDTYKLMEESLAPEQYGIGIKKGNEDLLTELQKALDELSSDGTAADISTKWFGENKVLN